MHLIHRDILDEAHRFFHTPDVLVVHGARQVGKTCLIKMMEEELRSTGETTHYIDLEDLRMLAVLENGPDALINHLRESGILKESRLYLFVDEIQYLSNPSSLMKLLRDHHSDRIKLIVSGSSSFDIRSKFTDSLAGRTVNFELFPLNFSEFLRFKGSQIQLGEEISSPPVIEQLVSLFTEYTLYGGYPRLVLETDVSVKETYLAQVINTYIRRDIRDLANIRHIQKFNKLLEVLASQCGQLLNVSELANTAGLSRPTVEKYLFILEQTYVIQLLRPFSSNIRSELFKTPKVFFHDTGIANLLALKGFPRTITGGMLENAVFSEFRKARDVSEFFYWRTQDGKEIDFIIPRGDSLIPIEVKKTGLRVRSTALRYFQEHYRPTRLVCMSLKKGGESVDVETRYPWEGI